MTTSTAVLPSVRAAFGALIDYAGLFPPAKLPPAQARAEYESARTGPHAWMLGRFIVGAGELASASEAFDLPLSVIANPEADALARVAELRRTGARIETIEIPLKASLTPFRDHLSPAEILDTIGALEADLAVNGLRDVPTFLEIPRVHPWWNELPQTMEVLERYGLGAKLRCGGVTAEAFPSVDEVAQFIEAARGALVPFKATAGLHHPVRHVDPATGFTMHGFLNVLAAAALAPRLDGETLLRVIAEEDPAAFAFDDTSLGWRDQRVELDAIARFRHDAFVSYGSCSFSEPVGDLTVLGILPAQ